MFSLHDYDLAATLASGQAFLWRPVADAWEGFVAGRWVRLRQTGEQLHAETAAPQRDWQWLRDYLQLDVDLAAVLATFPDDAPMRAAIAACRGLRLLRQEPWETLVSFICSSTKQIVQIQQIIALLCERFGEPISVGDDVRSLSLNAERGMPYAECEPAPPHIGGYPVFAFPSAARLAACSEAELRACKMGFRAPFVLAAARAVASGELDLARLYSLPTTEARAALMSLHGVGRKISDCVLLFGAGRLEAFPVDVWILRTMTERYGLHGWKPAQVAHFGRTHFGPLAGLAQQYLFAHERLVVSPAAGVFNPIGGLTDGTIISVGTVLGTIGDVEVRSPFAGELQSYIAVDGERVTLRQPIAWLRTA